MNQVLDTSKNRMIALCIAFLLPATTYFGIQIFSPKPTHPFYELFKDKNLTELKEISELDKEKNKEAALKHEEAFKKNADIYKEKIHGYKSVCLAVYIIMGILAFLSGIFIPLINIKLGLKYSAFIFFFMSFVVAPHTPIINFAFFIVALLFVLLSIFHREKTAKINLQE